MGEDVTTLKQTAMGEDALAHFGVKGMRWGVRRSQAELDSGAPTPVSVTTKEGSSKIKTSGGTKQGAADDAKRVAAIQQKLKKSGSNSLTNKEMQDLVTRMNLEQQLYRLAPPKQAKFKATTTKFLMDNGGKTLNFAAQYGMQMLVKRAFVPLEQKLKKQ